MVNLTKTDKAPPCLEKEKRKASENYRCNGVFALLKKDFFNKCYLCEQKGITSINVEHLIPHKGDRDLMFDWTNLFYACSHCNNTKGAKYHPILNCTAPKEDVENWVHYKINPYPKEKVSVRGLKRMQKLKIRFYY